MADLQLLTGSISHIVTGPHGLGGSCFVGNTGYLVEVHKTQILFEDKPGNLKQFKDGDSVEVIFLPNELPEIRILNKPKPVAPPS